MKIVVNRCYGGFGLSLKAQKRYLELIGKKAFFYRQTKFEHCDGVTEYTRIDNLNDDMGMLSHTVTKDLGESTTDIGGSRKSKHPDIYWYYGNLERNDPLLIQVVEELGESANGQLSKLEVVTIPDGVNFEIDDYDGIESIHEVHRSW